MIKKTESEKPFPYSNLNALSALMIPPGRYLRNVPEGGLTVTLFAGRDEKLGYRL